MKTKLKMAAKQVTKFKLRTTMLYGAAIVSVATIVGTLTFLYLNTGVHNTAFAAPTSISGVINSYLRVTAVNVSTRTFTADNLSGNSSDFQVGKTIMIYQAKGANITSTNTSSYGTVTAYNAAGNYEFAIISAVSSTSTLTITVSSLVNSYVAGNAVQIVSVPQYTDANVTGTLTATPWSNSQGRGGIVALQVENELTLGGSIDVSGQGFAGGIKEGSKGDCPDNTTYRSNSNDFAAKGEGISTDGRAYGRGPQASSGGGGNPHNAGGGGGSNYTTGGYGGQGYFPGGSCSDLNSGGMGGIKINYATVSNRAFFGGSGGAGQQNDNLASNGGNGGGIIVVRAKTVKSTCGGTYGFISNGQSASNSSGNDGAGGGGAGGTIILDVSKYTLSCNIVVRANGGNGGTVNSTAAHGGGGGGGVGVIMETIPTSNTNVLITSIPGTNGVDCTSGCSTPTGILPETPTSYKMSISSIPGQVITLPIKLASFTAAEQHQGVALAWTTTMEENNDFFTLEHSADGIHFESFEEVPGAGNSNTALHYSATDEEPYSKISYYRLKQTDYDGKFTYSKVIAVQITRSGKATSFLSPNPASEYVTVTGLTDSPMTIRFINERGIIVRIVETAGNSEKIGVIDLPNGIYVVEVVSDNQKQIGKLMVRH